MRDTFGTGLLRASSGNTHDAILLDVDNGPDGLTRVGNDSLYSMRGLDSARQALRPGGILAVWSAAPYAGWTGLNDGF